jgi:trans-aconitate 2-methyltransferase
MVLPNMGEPAMSSTASTANTALGDATATATAAGHRWDPAQYLRFGDERSRPFFDLVGRVPAVDPRSVVDLGCGPGQLTATLADRWPTARVLGVDSSPEMIEQAADHADDRVGFALGDLTGWAPVEPVDVVVSNATLQWVDGHDALLPALARMVRPGGWLAFQVPGNFGSPSHVAIAEQVRSPRWRDRIDQAVLDRPRSFEPAHYLEVLLDAGLEADVWETTYLHRLTGPDPVFNWVKGTALRPVLAALGPDDVAAFEAELAERLRGAYPAGRHGTTFPFRRIFAVAQVPMEPERG